MLLGTLVVSLTSFVRLGDVAERLKPFRPPTSRVNVPLKVPARHNSPQLTGTAFDYLLRFEIQRRAAHAEHGEWIAEKVPSIIEPPRSSAGTNSYRDYLWGKSPDDYIPPDELAERVRAVCSGARTAVNAHAGASDPSPDSLRVLAAWAVRLAKIDGVFRRDELDVTFEVAPPDLVEELVALLAAVPFDRIIRPGRVVLNPDFGEASTLVGGADADLVAGDALIDFKTTKSFAVRDDHLDQLFGYFLLARRAGVPEIKRVGVYFSRFGRLRSAETSVWTRRPDFEETERWFFQRAREVFGSMSGNGAPIP